MPCIPVVLPRNICESTKKEREFTESLPMVTQRGTTQYRHRSIPLSCFASCGATTCSVVPESFSSTTTTLQNADWVDGKHADSSDTESNATCQCEVTKALDSLSKDLKPSMIPSFQYLGWRRRLDVRYPRRWRYRCYFGLPSDTSAKPYCIDHHRLQ